MIPQLKKFISSYCPMDQNELDAIAARFQKKSVTKNEFVLKAGNVCEDVIFVESGCLRLYYIQEDVEVSVWFSFHDSSAIEINSFISEKPSEYFLQAIEDTVIWCLPKTELTALYSIYPGMQEMMRKFWEDVVINLLQRFTALQKDSAEKRYLDLLGKPTYMQRIPQKYLASFIGVTPTSLSRIRKNIK